MPAFHYRALDSGGQTLKGVLQADTARGARAALRDRGLFPIEVEELTAGRRGSRLGPTRLALLLRQLAVLTRAGLPLDEALAALADQERISAERGLVLALRARVMEGRALTAAMGEFPEAFPELARAAVAAAEQAGRLAEVLERLAGLYERRSRLLRRLLAALAYPLLLAVVALAVLVGLLLEVVPEVTRVLAGLGGELPAATRILLAMSGVLERHGLPLALLLLLVPILLALAARHPALRPGLERALLALPGAGTIRRRLAAARFTRTLAVLVGAAVPLLEALRLARGTLGASPLRAALDEVARRVREGSALAPALAASGLLPPVALRLVAGGERSGRLAEMLERAAEEQESELELALETAAGLVGPLAILLLGGLVLFIVLAILLPIFELNRLVR